MKQNQTRTEIEPKTKNESIIYQISDNYFISLGQKNIGYVSDILYIEYCRPPFDSTTISILFPGKKPETHLRPLLNCIAHMIFCSTPNAAPCTLATVCMNSDTRDTSLGVVVLPFSNCHSQS